MSGDIAFDLANLLPAVSFTLTPTDPVTGTPIAGEPTITFVDPADPIAASLVGALRGAKGDTGDTGATGATGATGPAGGNPSIFETVAVADGALVHDVGATPTYPVAVYINGLRQRSTAFSVAASIVTLPATLNIMVGDLIQIEF